MAQEAWIPEQTFGTRLAMVRRHMAWNIKEAAAQCGLDDGSWSNWERGVLPRNMAVVVEQIHRATGADRDWLMWGIGSPTGRKSLTNPPPSSAWFTADEVRETSQAAA